MPQFAYAGSNVTGRNGLIAVDKVGNAIRFYDPVTLHEMKALVAPEPCVHELAIAPDHRRAFVPLYGDGIYGSNRNPNNKILALDLVRREIADVIDLGEFIAPHGMVADAEGRLWVVCDLANVLLHVDPQARRVAAAYPCPAKGPHVLSLTPDGSRIYVSSKEGDLAAFDVASRAFVASVPVRAPGVTGGNGSGSEGVTPTPVGDRLVVVDNDRGDLHVIDIASNREIDRIPLAQNPPSNARRSRLAKLMFSPDGAHLVVTAYAGGCAWVIDAADYRRQTLVPVAKGPQGMAFPPDSGSVLVSSHDSGLLTRIDLASRRAVAAYDGGAGIEVLAFY